MPPTSQSCRPDFAIVLYPGHLWTPGTDLSLRPDIRLLRADTPPAFLLHAEDDHVDDVKYSLAYYVALQKVGVPTEMHLYAQGGHAFGLRPSKLPIAVAAVGGNVTGKHWNGERCPSALTTRSTMRDECFPNALFARFNFSTRYLQAP